MRRSQFRGAIIGVGSTSGVRVVVGHWPSSPFGAFADVMVETAHGERILLAPTEQVARFVGETYTFDTVRIEPVDVVESDGVWAVRTASLSLDVEVGARTLLGWLLRLVPHRIAQSPAWCTVTDPIARVVMRGVRTRGTAGGGRREWYGATDNHRVLAAGGVFDGTPVGDLRPVDPPPQFGFSSTPVRPSITRVVTTVEW